jgi:UDP-glucose 4-epimerase
LPLQSSLMSKTYLKSDHFQWGRIDIADLRRVRTVLEKYRPRAVMHFAAYGAGLYCGSDIADAHVRALNYLLERGKSCEPNLANSRGYSVKEVIAVAEKVCSRSIPLETASRRSRDPADSNRGTRVRRPGSLAGNLFIRTWRHLGTIIAC